MVMKNLTDTFRQSNARWFAANDDYLFGPFLLAINTSWRGNLPNKSGRCPKLVASTSAGLPAIHCDRSDRLIDSRVQPYQDTTRLIAHIFNRVAVTLRNVSDVTLPQSFDTEAAM